MAAAAVTRLVPVTRNQGQQVPDFKTAPTWVDVVVLTANTAKPYTVKAGCPMLRMTPTVIPTYGSFLQTAALPTVDVTDGTASFPVGGQTHVVVPSTAETLSLICASACVVTIEVWN